MTTYADIVPQTDSPPDKKRSEATVWNGTEGQPSPPFGHTGRPDQRDLPETGVADGLAGG